MSSDGYQLGHVGKISHNGNDWLADLIKSRHRALVISNLHRLRLGHPRPWQIPKAMLDVFNPHGHLIDFE